MKENILKYPHTKEELQLINSRQELASSQPHLLLESSADSFFAPLQQAKINYALPAPSLTQTLLTVIPRLALAFSAAALAISPSKKYAETENENPLIYQISCVLSGLLINLYGINCLVDEIQYVERVRLEMIVSTILGIMSTLPIFFIQQIVDDTPSDLSLLTSMAITLGSMPLQILGFLEFCQHVYPEKKRLHLHLSLQPDQVALHELEVTDIFLKQLECGLRQCLLHNEIPDNFLHCTPHEFMKTLLIQGEKTVLDEGMDSVMQKFGLLISGCLGIFLAEAGNIAFIKATYVSLTPHIPYYMASILTFCITFPAATLSAEFGFNAACAIYLSILKSIDSLHHMRACGDVVQSLQPSLGMHAVSEVMMSMMAMLIISCSYASSVQFNRDLFANNVLPETLDMLNLFTILGILLFNNYVLNFVSHRFLSVGLSYVGTPEVKERAKFYRLSQSVLFGYRKMPKNLIVDGVEQTLEAEVSEGKITFPSP